MENFTLPIMNWLYVGPFTRDVSKLYQDNYIVPIAPYQSYIDEAEKRFQSLEEVKESDSLTLYDETQEWKRLRIAQTDKKVTWAGFGVYARLMTVFAHTRIWSEKECEVNCRLFATGSIFVRINGEEVFRHIEVGRCSGEYQFPVKLCAGKNTCEVMLLNVHLHCLNSFSITMLPQPLRTDVQLLPEVRERDLVEEKFNSFYLNKNLLHPGESPEIYSDINIRLSGKFFWEISPESEKSSGKGQLKQKGELIQNGNKWEMVGLTLMENQRIFKIQISYADLGAKKVYGASLGFNLIRFLTEIPKVAWNGRRSFLLRHLAESELNDPQDILLCYREFAKLASGQCDLFNEEQVQQTINYVNDRYDCSDFAMHGILRLYARYRNSSLLSDKLKQSLKNCILNFKYWVDEPGKSMMFTRSENHEMLFHSAEYIAGSLFPTEVFSNSGQNGLFHILKGRTLAERWIKEKGRWGFVEWHSNAYYEENILSLLGIYDFGEENSAFRRLSKNLLDLIVVMIATHSHHGVMATTHGRCYEQSLMYPETESMGRINWLLFGEPSTLTDQFSIGAIALCDSGYCTPDDIEKLALSELPLQTHTRMGMFQDRGGDGVNCSVYRTGDYMVSGLVESRAGEKGDQVNAGQALLDGKVPVFVTCFDNNLKTTRPSYWGGQYVIPKTIAHKNVLAYIYRIETTVGHTHCYFPIEQFDEVAEQANWIFGRKNNAYIAVYSQHPYEKTSQGTYRNRELLCMEKENIWIFEMGSKKENGSFRHFIQQVSNADLKDNGKSIVYHSPNLGVIRLGWELVCDVNGEQFLEQDFPLIENEYVFGAYGSGEISGKGTKKSLNFNY